jgi:hypothetical protein
METWALIIYLYINRVAAFPQVPQPSIVSMTSVTGFASIAECQKAGDYAKASAVNLVTRYENAKVHYVCVSQTSKKVF